MVWLSLPSRARPRRLIECVESARATADGPVQALVRVDDDDPHLEDYENIDDVDLMVGSRVTLGRAFDEAAQHAVRRGARIIMMCGDDIRFRTPGWDRLVAAALDAWPDRIGLVYGRDGIHDEKLATHGFVSDRWIRTIGFVPHQILGNCADTWLHTIASRIGRLQYLPDVHTEHLHPRVGKALIDDTYRERPPHRDAKKVYRTLNVDAAAEKLRQQLKE